jgi:hypothetical protein
MITFLFLVVLFIILHNASQNQGEEVGVLGYKTRFFHVSAGASKRSYEKMKYDGVHPDQLKEFIALEDEFMRLVRVAVCTGVSRRNQGYALSDEIKEKFKPYDFEYHVTLLKQIAEPHKVIIQNIRC